MKDYDLDYNEYARCPYCGYEDIDSFELNCDEEEITVCPNCEKKYGVIRNVEVTVTYSTWKVDDKNDC